MNNTAIINGIYLKVNHDIIITVSNNVFANVRNNVSSLIFNNFISINTLISNNLKSEVNE
jgi:hypothetical protein